MIKAGIIGTGKNANSHARAINANGNKSILYAVADIDYSKAQAFAEQYNAEKIYLDYKELLADDQIDMVCVCTPPFNHAEISINAAKAGKAVLCEKPIAGSLQELDAIVQASETSGSMISGIFQNRFGDGFRVFDELQKSGRAGKMLFAQLNSFWQRPMKYYNMAPWRGTWEGEKGGITISNGIHGIDLFCKLTPKHLSVNALAATLNHQIKPLTLYFSLHHSDQSILILFLF